MQREKILLPPLHIKPSLIKLFVTALDIGGEPFQHIRLMFPKLSEAKVNGGIFVGPQVKVMLASEALEAKMSNIKNEPWRAFRAVVARFLGNNKAPDNRDLVLKMINAYERMGCRMLSKLHYLRSHLEGVVSSGHGNN